MSQIATRPSSEIVSLAPGPNGGLDVPVDALRLVFELLERDLALETRGEQLFVKGPNGSKPDLSGSDVERIKKYKFHLIALLAYVAPERSALLDVPFEM